MQVFGWLFHELYITHSLNVDAELSSRLRNLKCLFYYSMGIRWSLKFFRCTNSLKFSKNCFIMSFRKCQFVCCGIICHLHNKYHLDWGPNSRSAEGYVLLVFVSLNLPNFGLIVKYFYISVDLCAMTIFGLVIWYLWKTQITFQTFRSYFSVYYIWVVSGYLISWRYPDKCVNLWITKFLVDFSTN